MDLMASCKDKLAYFRIKELKEVLTHLGLSKQGKKQDLVDRILNFLSSEPASGIWPKKSTVGREGAAKLIDEIYRKMQGSGTSNPTSKSEDVAGSISATLKEEAECSTSIEKTRCVCGSTVQTDSMIMCEDPRCNVWQHIACVLIPEKPMEGLVPKLPDIFYCELCRLKRADPFWVAVTHPLYPVKLSVTNFPADGSNPSQSIEKKFQLSRTDRDLLTKQEYDVQVWCMLLNDKVTFRVQWPQYADLQVNGVPVRTTNRPASQLLGANGRDDGQIITHCTRDGINKIFLGGCDARIFCLGVRIVKRRTLPQVINMIPKEGEGECFEDALSRVQRCVGGGAATENADSDSDIEVVADCIPVNLRCPMSGLRMKVAGRFKDCAHMGCFDLEVFVEINQQSRKWQCPICLKNYSLEKIIIDPYFNRITSKMQNCADDVTEIEVKPDGSWRAKSENGDRKGLGELGLWHLPDGSIVSAMAVDRKSLLEPKQIKEEFDADSHSGLQLGSNKNQNGVWQFNQLNALRGISHTFGQNLEPNVQNMIPMSSSATGSGRECENGSVNQGAGAHLDISAINGSEYESVPMNIDPAAQNFTDQLLSVPAGDTDVIILSDSEEDLDPMLSSAAAYRNNGSGNGEVPFPDPRHVIHDPYYEDPLGKGIDLYGSNGDDFGINIWGSPSGGQGGPGFQLFGSDVDVAGTLLDMQNNSLNCAPSLNGFALTGETVMGSVPFTSGSADKAYMHDSLLGNPLPYGSNDPSLQIFLPTAPSDGLAAHSDLRNQPDTPNGVGNEDWISLRLGDAGMGQAAMNNGSLRQQQQPRSSSTLHPMADSGSLLLGTYDNLPNKATRGISESPSPIPRQPRSVRSRSHLSIDSDYG